jgi:hypothetical protein
MDTLDYLLLQAKMIDCLYRRHARERKPLGTAPLLMLLISVLAVLMLITPEKYRLDTRMSFTYPMMSVAAVTEANDLNAMKALRNAFLFPTSNWTNSVDPDPCSPTGEKQTDG